jgi:hypothetical protein
MRIGGTAKAHSGAVGERRGRRAVQREHLAAKDASA